MYSTYPPISGEVLIPLPPGHEASANKGNRRPPTIYNKWVPATDVNNASTKQHTATTKIASQWRGFRLRKSLATKTLTGTFHNRKAIKIQSAYRKYSAKIRRRYLVAAREEKAKKIVERYNAAKLKEFKSAVDWQKKLFNDAASKVQAVFRWYYANKYHLAEGQEPLPYPLEKRRKDKWFPECWRRAQEFFKRGGQNLETGSLGTPGIDDQPHYDSTPDRSLALVPPSSITKASLNGAVALKSQPGEVVAFSPQPPSGPRSRFRGPPTQAEVEEINTQMRKKEWEVQVLLHTESQLQRKHMRQEGIVAADLEHCAGVLQRRFRTNLAKQELHSRECLKEYLERYATIIQCAYRSYVARRRAKEARRSIGGDAWLATRRYGTAQVESMKVEFVWNANVMTRAALTIQAAFRRFSYLKKYKGNKSTGSESYLEYCKHGPKSLPLGLLKDCPEYKKSPEIRRSNESDRRPKYVFRRFQSRDKRRAAAEKKAKEEAEAKAKEEAKQKAEAKAREEAEAKAHEEAEAKAKADAAALAAAKSDPHADAAAEHHAATGGVTAGHSGTDPANDKKHEPKSPASNPHAAAHIAAPIHSTGTTVTTQADAYDEIKKESAAGDAIKAEPAPTAASEEL